jgi:hypothetical protein
MPKSLSAQELLPPSSLLTLTTVERTDAGWTVMAQGPDHARCPRCRQVSTARPSRYVRTLKDLPAVGATVSLQIRVARWRCGTRACAGRLFADRLPDIAEFRGRRTCRANVVIRLIGYALGGRPGERLARRIGLSVSALRSVWVRSTKSSSQSGLNMSVAPSARSSADTVSSRK